MDKLFTLARIHEGAGSILSALHVFCGPRVGILLGSLGNPVESAAGLWVEGSLLRAIHFL